jgi:hypothetical protein
METIRDALIRHEKRGIEELQARGEAVLGD